MGKAGLRQAGLYCFCLYVWVVLQINLQHYTPDTTARTQTPNTTSRRPAASSNAVHKPSNSSTARTMACCSGRGRAVFQRP